MKINFIRHISDDILKENQELKTALVNSKHQLNIYERQMLDFIQLCRLQAPVLATPQQTLQLFISIVREEIDSRKQEENKVQQTVEKMDKVNRQLVSLQQELHKRKNDEELREKKWREGRLAAEELEYEMRQEISGLKLKEQMLKNELKEVEERSKIKTLAMEECQRKEIQQVRQHHHKIMMEQRDRMQEENLREEKSLRQQIQQRQRRVKQLEKMVQKLASSAKLDSSQTTLFSSLVKSLQESNRTGKSIQTLKEEVFELKQQAKDLSRLNLNLQSCLTESKVKEQNYMSQIERQRLERGQLENKLQIKIREIERHEEAKQSMESYYANKWNQEFKNMKHNMEKTYNLKLSALQKEYWQKGEEFQVRTEEIEAKIRKYEARNGQLESIFKSNQTTLQNMQKMVDESQNHLARVQRQKQETWRLSREELISTRSQYESRTECFRDSIQQLQEEMIKREKKYDTISNLFNETLREKLEATVTKMTKQLTEQSEGYEIEKKGMINKHGYEVSQLKKEIENYKGMVESIKEEVVGEYEQRLNSVITSKEEKLKEKEEQCLKKIEKAAYKYKQLQLKFGSLKKEIDEERHSFSRDMLIYEREIQSFKKIRSSLEEEIGKHSLVKEDLKKEKDNAYDEIAKLKSDITHQEKEVEELKATTEQAVVKANELIILQTSWQDQVIDLQRELRSEFQEMKHIAEEEISILKSKLWYLQEKTKQPVISQKNYQKMRELEEQKEELKNMVDIKEAENIILSQVKSYYETRFRQSEYNEGEKERKVSRVVLARKLTHDRKQSCKDTYSNRIFQEPKEMSQMRKYIIQNSRKKQHELMSRTGYKEFSYMERIKTNPL